MSIARAVVVFPTPLGPISAEEHWLGGNGCGGCGNWKTTYLGRFNMSLLVALKCNVHQFWRGGLDEAYNQVCRLDARVVEPQSDAAPERPALGCVVAQGVCWSQALKPLFAEQRHLLVRIQDAKDDAGICDARNGLELAVKHASRGCAANEVQAGKEPEALPVCLVTLVNPDSTLPNGRLGIELRVQALAVAV